MIRKPNSIIIVLLFIQNNSQFKHKAKTCLPPSMLSSPSIVHVQGFSAPQMFSKQQMSPFELCSCCSCHVFSYNFAQFLLLKRVKCPPFFVFTTKTTQPRPQVFSVNGALTCKNAAFLVKHKILPNLVINNWLWQIMRVLLVNQNWANILNE